MKLWRVVPLFALAQASCYDYEYYDPDTGSSLPGNACAKQQAAGGATASATIGQPVAAQATFTQAGAFPQASTSFVSAPAAVGTTTYGALATPYISSAPVATTSVYGSPAVVASTPVFGAATTVYGTPAATTTVYGTPAATAVYSSPAAVSVSYGTPAVAVSSQVSASARVAATGNGNSNPQLSAQLQYYKRLGEQQQRQHRQNKKIVDDASRELSRGSLVNQIVAGSGNVAPWYPAYRLSAQRDAAGAYKSESRIANKNANDAYQRYQQNPTRLNLLVSKYQDLNADLRDAAYHYNVVNSGTFGQITTAASLFGFGNLGLLGGLTQIVTQRQESNDLNDIQRQMQRVARQIQTEAKAATSGSGSASASASVQTPQGSVQQRMMAMSVYGPNRG